MMRFSNRQDGFTLVEVMVALVIFSVAIVGLTHSGTESVRAVSVLQNKTFAGIVADNQLVYARLRPLKTGVETGEEQAGERVYEWRTETVETESNDFYQIVVTVNLKNDDQTLISRTAFRLGRNS